MTVTPHTVSPYLTNMLKPYLLLILLALSAGALTGCDSNDEEDYSEILGRWEAPGDINDPDVYLNISDDDIVAHFFDDEEGTDTACFTKVTFDVVSRSGNTWQLRDESGDTENVIFRRDGDVLVSESPDIEDGDIIRFNRSTQTDFTPLCNP